MMTVTCGGFWKEAVASDQLAVDVYSMENSSVTKELFDETVKLTVRQRCLGSSLGQAAWIRAVAVLLFSEMRWKQELIHSFDLQQKERGKIVHLRTRGMF